MQRRRLPGAGSDTPAHLPSSFVSGACEVQRACVRCGVADGEPDPLRLILVHPPVVGMRLHVGKGILQLERPHCLDIVLQNAFQHFQWC